MAKDRFPDLLPESVELLLASKLDDEINPVIIEFMLGERGDASSAAQIMANLDHNHMIDDKQRVTPLGAKVGRFWKDYLASRKLPPDKHP